MQMQVPQLWTGESCYMLSHGEKRASGALLS